MPKKHKGQEGRKDLIMMVPEALKIVADSEDPRFDPRSQLPIDEAMVASIMALGVIQPITIYADGDDVYVSTGHQRRINAIEANKRLKKAGQPTVLMPCVWRKDDDVRLFTVRQAENNVRRGDGAVDRAKNMQRLIDLGGSKKDVAIAFGCTERTVANTLALLDCDTKVQRAIDSGQVPATVAAELAKLPREKQRERLDKMAAAGATKGRRAKEAAKTGRTEDKPPKMLSRAFIERLRNEISAFVPSDALVAEAIVEALDVVLGKRALEDIEHVFLLAAAERASSKKPRADGATTEMRA